MLALCETLGVASLGAGSTTGSCIGCSDGIGTCCAIQVKDAWGCHVFRNLASFVFDMTTPGTLDLYHTQLNQGNNCKTM
jgi:hypothetical protein